MLEQHPLNLEPIPTDYRVSFLITVLITPQSLDPSLRSAVPNRRSVAPFLVTPLLGVSFLIIPLCLPAASLVLKPGTCVRENTTINGGPTSHQPLVIILVVD